MVGVLVLFFRVCEFIFCGDGICCGVGRGDDDKIVGRKVRVWIGF